MDARLFNPIAVIQDHNAEFWGNLLGLSEIQQLGLLPGWLGKEDYIYTAHSTAEEKEILFKLHTDKLV